MKNIKSKLIKIIPLLIVVILLGWGMSISATDDIKSATANFSVLGIVSNISEGDLTITDAKGSDKSGKTSYDLNIDHLESMQTSAYIPLNFTDIKVGDKIIAQGLTNGDTFFIKRIISFTSVPTPVEPKEVATTTATSTATSTDEVATTTVATSTEVQVSGDSVNSTSSTSTSSTAEAISTTTSTTTEESSATSTSVIETVTNVIEEIINTVTDTVQNVVDTVTGNNNQTPTQENPPAPSTE